MPKQDVRFCAAARPGAGAKRRILFQRLFASVPPVYVSSGATLLIDIGTLPPYKIGGARNEMSAGAAHVFACPDREI